ncbi:MAG: calcium-binding protein [Hyphomonadaceae bacterium]
MPLISGDFTVFEDETYTASGTVFTFDTLSYVLFLNLGQIIATGSLSESARAFSSSNGFGLIDNRGLVSSTSDSGDAYGLSSGDWNPDITNSGTWAVRATGWAYGVETWSPGNRVTNDGEWIVNGGSGAVGMMFVNPATVVNNQDIIVSATGPATGVTIMRFDNDVFTNNGSITVTGSTSVALSLTGLALAAPTAPTIINTGSITAQTAIFCWNQFSPPQEKIDWLFNTGTINGLIDLGLGNDQIDNQGVINGDVFTYVGADVIDTSTGFISGVVYLGDGNDEFRGGAQGQVVFGGLGNDLLNGGDGDDEFYGENAVDTLNGGGGDDYLSGGSAPDTIHGGAGADTLIGGSGADALDGGSGTDTASYAGSTSVTVRLWNGTGSGGDAQGDTLTGIENLIGSANNDTLIGADAIANVLDGGTGNDYLAGLSGNDTLIGGAGAGHPRRRRAPMCLTAALDIDTASYAGSTSVTVKLE